VRIVGHRGACATHPENTIASFEEAWAQGADAIEFDVQITRDHVAVLYHDKTLSKIGAGRRRISQCTYDELARLDFGGWFSPRFRGEPIARLDRVLRYAAKGHGLLVELKPTASDWRELVDIVVDQLPRGRARAAVSVLCFDAPVLAAVRRRDADLDCVLNEADPHIGSALLAALGPAQALCCPARRATAELAQWLADHGRELWVYRCDTDYAVVRAARAGVRLAMSDRPRWLREQFERVQAATRGQPVRPPSRTRTRARDLSR
jgi:glycerophosphoryl diester phosphodiesterase